MAEQWERWYPINDLATKYYEDYLYYTATSIILILCDEQDQKIQITFKKETVQSYRSIDESFRLKMIHDLSATYGDSFYGDWTMFKVHKSLYIQWLMQESGNSVNALSLQHYAFLSANFIVDILSSEEPIVELLSSTTTNT